MKRKRAPGGGRKPQGPFKGNKRSLLIRVMPETYQALKASSRKRKLSMSQAGQFHLRRSLLRDHHPSADIVALTEAIAIVIRYVQDLTKEKWRDSAFTTAAIRPAVDALLCYWGNREATKVPRAIKKRMAEPARKGPGEYSSVNFSDPAEVGDLAAGQLINQIENRGVFGDEDDPLNWAQDHPGVFVPPEWGLHRTILRNLGPRWPKRK